MRKTKNNAHTGSMMTGVRQDIARQRKTDKTRQDSDRQIKTEVRKTETRGTRESQRPSTPTSGFTIGIATLARLTGDLTFPAWRSALK